MTELIEALSARHSRRQANDVFRTFARALALTIGHGRARRATSR